MKHKKIIEETETTPRFELDMERGIINFKGRSIPSDPNLFFVPVEGFVDKYLENPAKTTIVTIMVDYFNTPSDKWLLHILRKMEAIYSFGKDIKITWYYEEGDDDMQKAGEYYKSILKIPFELKEVKDTIL